MMPEAENLIAINLSFYTLKPVKKHRQDRFEMETSIFFEKSVLSNDVLMGHTDKMIFSWNRHKKEGFPEADTFERTMMKHYK